MADTNPTLTLRHLLDADRPARSVVAWRGAAGDALQTLRWDGFRAQVAGLRAVLESLPSGSVALYTADAYAFAVGLFGIWHAGRVAVCPPNAQPEALAALSDVVIAAVSDGPAVVRGRPLIAPESSPATPGAHASQGTPPLGPLPLAPDSSALELFTSGTTGSGKAVAKGLCHLEGELQMLERNLGGRVGDAAVVASASQQHLYGMLFRVLWPLATGRAFHARSLLQMEELLPPLRAQPGSVLVSVPAHLKRLAERDGLAQLARHCRTVFSSGGPLDPDTAERWAQACGEAPVEVFGSTETGGVAWRQQQGGGSAEAWQPFDGVRVDCDRETGRLRVHSPLASVGDARSGFLMGDRVALLEDGRFLLQGRADRVLKIGERRLSMPDMEERLREHPFVDSAALLPLERRGETRVAAVVVLDAQGRRELDRRGRRALANFLRDALAEEWERVLVPRHFRFVPALPEDAQGKTTLARLRSLFDPGHTS